MKISEATEQMLELENLKYSRISINNDLVTNKTMNKENEEGIVYELNGEVGEVLLSDGRKGKIIIQLDFTETAKVLSEKEYGS